MLQGVKTFASVLLLQFKSIISISASTYFSKQSEIQDLFITATKKPVISGIILSQCVYKGGIKQFIRGISPRGQSLQDWQYSFYFLLSPQENERNFQYEHTYTYTCSTGSRIPRKVFYFLNKMCVISIFSLSAKFI